jgi:hypothetical protein
MSTQPVDATVDTYRRLLTALTVEQCARPPSHHRNRVRPLVERMDRPLDWDEWCRDRAGYAALGREAG